MGISLSGIGGFDTTQIVSQLMQIERQAGQRYTQQRAQLRTGVTAFQGLNSKLADLTKLSWEIIGKAAKTDTSLDPTPVWGATKGTSNHDKVTISTSGGAAVGSVEFDVKQKAQSKQVLLDSNQFHALVGDGNSISIAAGDKVVNLTPKSNSMKDVAAAINAAKDAGVSATVVRTGDGVDGKGQYVLQLTGKETGEVNGNFKIFQGDVGLTATGEKERSDDSVAGTITYKFKNHSALLAGLSGSAEFTDLKTTRESSNAVIRMFGEEYSYSSNQIELLDKVKVDISALTQETKADGTPKDPNFLAKSISIEVVANREVAGEKVKGMVESMNAIMESITAGMQSTDKTGIGIDGKSYSYKEPGVFSNSMGRQIKDGISNLVASGITLEGRDGSKQTYSLEDFGVKLKLSGNEIKFEYDATKFKEAMEKDPAKTQEALIAFSTKVADLGQDMSDSMDGMVTKYIKSREEQVKAYEQTIQDFNDRMDEKEKALKRQYSTLETQLTQYNSKFAAIQGQLASLGTMSSR